MQNYRGSLPIALLLWISDISYFHFEYLYYSNPSSLATATRHSSFRMRFDSLSGALFSHRGVYWAFFIASFWWITLPRRLKKAPAHSREARLLPRHTNARPMTIHQQLPHLLSRTLIRFKCHTAQCTPVHAYRALSHVRFRFPPLSPLDILLSQVGDETNSRQ